VYFSRDNGGLTECRCNRDAPNAMKCLLNPT
jgi:hypothetical protein